MLEDEENFCIDMNWLTVWKLSITLLGPKKRGPNFKLSRYSEEESPRTSNGEWTRWICKLMASLKRGFKLKKYLNICDARKSFQRNKAQRQWLSAMITSSIITKTNNFFELKLPSDLTSDQKYLIMSLDALSYFYRSENLPALKVGLIVVNTTHTIHTKYQF